MLINLETGRLSIRPPMPHDVAKLSKAVTDSYVSLAQWYQWINGIPGETDIEMYVHNCLSYWNSEAPTELDFIVTNKKTEELVGMVGLHHIDRSKRQANIGFWGVMTNTGKGYIVEAVNVLTRYAISELNLNRLEIRCYSKNENSYRIPEYLGYTREASVQPNDVTYDKEKFGDVVIYVRKNLNNLPPVNLDKYKVNVESHSNKWHDMFEQEAKKIAKVFGKEVVMVRHIGSTAIPNVIAKPIIDILVAVKSINKVDDYNDRMADIGYESKGEYGMPGRRFFFKSTVGELRSHHVHVFQYDNPEIIRHIIFHEYMRTHTDEAKAYSDLKRKLAALYPDDIQSYVWGRIDLLKTYLKELKHGGRRKNPRSSYACRPTSAISTLVSRSSG